jgi:hypothetical protein
MSIRSLAAGQAKIGFPEHKSESHFQSGQWKNFNFRWGERPREPEI